MGVLVTDTFTEASDTDLTAHTPDTGTGWTERINDATTAVARIFESVDTCGATANEGAKRIVVTSQPDPTAADVDVIVDTAFVPGGGTDDPFGLVARYQDTTHMYSAGAYANANAEDKGIWLIDGSFPGTQLAGGNADMFNGDTLKFELRGSTLTLYLDSLGAGFSSVATVSDSTITAAGQAGLFWGNVTDIAADDIVTGWGGDNYSLEEFASASTFPDELFKRRQNTLLRL